MLHPVLTFSVSSYSLINSLTSRAWASIATPFVQLLFLSLHPAAAGSFVVLNVCFSLIYSSTSIKFHANFCPGVVPVIMFGLWASRNKSILNYVISITNGLKHTSNKEGTHLHREASRCVSDFEKCIYKCNKTRLNTKDRIDISLNKCQLVSYLKLNIE